jgi:hypothetical protein
LPNGLQYGVMSRDSSYVRAAGSLRASNALRSFVFSITASSGPANLAEGRIVVDDERTTHALKAALASSEVVKNPRREYLVRVQRAASGISYAPETPSLRRG